MEEQSRSGARAAEPGVEPAEPRVPGLKGSSYPNFIPAVFHPQSQALHLVVTEGKGRHHRPHCLGRKPGSSVIPCVPSGFRAPRSVSPSVRSVPRSVCESVCADVCVSLGARRCHSGSTSGAFLAGPLRLLLPTWNPLSTEEPELCSWSYSSSCAVHSLHLQGS